MKVLEELMAWAKESNPAMYYKVKSELNKEENGYHYDEEFAKYLVSNMHSQMGTGEHWGIEQVKAVVQQYQDRFHDGDNCWDVYVALHVFWHDLGANYKKRVGAIYENPLIDDAITFFFMDEDGPEGKVFRYFESMMN